MGTPTEIVELFWRITRAHRNRFGSVLDMGAGDGRFANGGNYNSYDGVEIDRGTPIIPELPSSARVSYGCVFHYRPSGFSACIGNPPYVRHHDIEADWRERVINSIEKSLGFHLDRRSNLFLYFLSLGLMKSGSEGLVSMIVPFEWVSRPSAKTLRRFLEDQQWAVSVYRFESSIFKEVLTTSCVTIIDKSKRSASWKFFNIDSSLRIRHRRGLSGTTKEILPYEGRGKIWALRGLSPGSQQVFTLTEWERLHHGLKLTDVTPCITTLRRIPAGIPNLNTSAFQEFFVEAGHRCWLINSHRRLSKTLEGYLNGVASADHDNYTCNTREPWYRYTPHPSPTLLVSSGFVKFGPKVMINSVGAIAVGSVYGVHTASTVSARRLRNYLASVNFEQRVVPHAAKLKKIEVKQLNGVLKAFLVRAKSDAR